MEGSYLRAAKDTDFPEDSRTIQINTCIKVFIGSPNRNFYSDSNKSTN